MCIHTIIVSCVLFILSCTTLEVWICVHYICIILLLRHKYSESLQYRHNWCQLPLRISHRPSRANSGAFVPAPMVALPFRQVLTSICPTPVPPTPHPVHPPHPSHTGSNQPAHRHPSRANGGAPVPAPMVDLPFWRLLTSIRPIPVSPTTHPIHPSHPSHPGSKHPMRKNQCFLI